MICLFAVDVQNSRKKIVTNCKVRNYFIRLRKHVAATLLTSYKNGQKNFEQQNHLLLASNIFLIFHSLGRQAKYLFCVLQQELWGLVEILKLVLVLTNTFFLCHHSLWSWFKLALDRIKPYFEIWYFDDGFSILHFKRFFPMLNSVEKYQLIVFLPLAAKWKMR